MEELIIFLHKEKLDVSLLLFRTREKYTAWDVTEGLCVWTRLCVSQVAVTFAVGSEVGLQSSSDFSQMGKPFLMGTVALGKLQLCAIKLTVFLFFVFFFLSLCLCGPFPVCCTAKDVEANDGLTFHSSCYQNWNFITWTDLLRNEKTSCLNGLQV